MGGWEGENEIPQNRRLLVKRLWWWKVPCVWTTPSLAPGFLNPSIQFIASKKSPLLWTIKLTNKSLLYWQSHNHTAMRTLCRSPMCHVVIKEDAKLLVPKRNYEVVSAEWWSWQLRLSKLEMWLGWLMVSRYISTASLFQRPRSLMFSLDTPFIAAVTAASLQMEWPKNPSVGIPAQRSNSRILLIINCLVNGWPKGREKSGWIGGCEYDEYRFWSAVTGQRGDAGDDASGMHVPLW